MDNILDKVFGAGYTEKGKKLNAELLKIQEKYKSWFDKNLKEDEFGEKNDITYYKILRTDAQGHSFSLTIDNLPEEIWVECNQKFKEIYGSDKQ